MRPDWIRRLPVALTLSGLLICFFCPRASSQAVDVGSVQNAMRIGDYEQAIEIAKQQVEKKTWNEAWPRLLAQNLLTLGRYSEALEVYKASLDRFSDSLRLRLLGYRILLANNQPLEAQALLDDLTTQIQRSPWKYSTKSELVPLGEFFLLQGEEPKQVLKLCYDQALKSDPKNLEALKAIASMGIEKSDTKVAVDAIEKGLKIAQGDPELLLLAADAWKSSDQNRFRDYLEQALEINPKHIPCLLRKAETFMDSESYDQAIECLTKIEEINPNSEEMWALKAAIAHLKGRYNEEGSFRSKAFAFRKMNPIVDHKIGKHLSFHYRFAEGAQYQQRALSMDSKYHAARTQLAQDLLRLGREKEGWEMVELARQADPYHVTSYNLHLLNAQIQKYDTIEAPGLILRMDAVESKVFGKEVINILREARESLSAKYKAELTEDTTVELFARQRDFAVRTFGMPGGEGFLGVCFGNLVTANSPTALSVNHNWKSVLWHEYCHVITLNLTSNRIPRWLSEGISVYEERLHRPNWGEPPNAIYLHWLRSGEFEPPSRMSKMFLSPKSGMHLQYAYYVSSIVVEFLVEQFGHDGLLKLLSDLRDGIPIADAIARRAGTVDGIDQAFENFAKTKGFATAEKLDFAPIPQGETWEHWLQMHPNSYAALHKKLGQQMMEQNWADSTNTAAYIYDAWPTDPSSESALAKLAMIHRKSSNHEQEKDCLIKLAELDPHAPEPLKRLIEIAETSDDWDAIANACRSLLEINPMQITVLELFANACEKLKRFDELVDALESISHLDPIDPALLNYRLAVAYDYDGKKPDAALRHCLMALEESPRYKDALELLLKLKK